MDILWTGLGICVVVGVVFYILAASWRRVLLSHARALRQLSKRMQALEALEDPYFRRRVGDSTPSPLEQVFTFSLHLSDRFWRETLGASPEEMEFIRSHGKLLGSAKIEKWRSHSVVTISEVLPQSRLASWQTRRIDIYPSDGVSVAPTLLWELPLAPQSEEGLAARVPPTLELVLRDQALELGLRRPRASEGEGLEEENVFFTVPLEKENLGAFRKREEGDEDAEATSATGRGARQEDFWLTFFECQDEMLGFDWQLCLRDLTKKAEWDRWKVVEPLQARRVS